MNTAFMSKFLRVAGTIIGLGNIERGVLDELACCLLGVWGCAMRCCCWEEFRLERIMQLPA